MWRDMYRMERMGRDLERILAHPGEVRVIGQRGPVRKAWHACVDEVKALLTELGFHVLTLVLVVAANVIWFGGIIWLVGVWLEG